MATLETSLRRGLDELGLRISDAQVIQLLGYLALLEKWTRVYNLTSVRDPAGMLTHHLLDSLAVIAPLRRQMTAFGKDAGAEISSGTEIRLLDVGSGAGLPGVVIAICCPGFNVDCVDTVGKKAAFIQQAALTLRLPNLRGIHARVESLSDKYQVISARAFASLADFTAWSLAALAEGGVWMAMKGRHPSDEITALPPQVKVFHVEQLQVPGLAAARCIVWMHGPRHVPKP